MDQDSINLIIMGGSGALLSILGFFGARWKLKKLLKPAMYENEQQADTYSIAYKWSLIVYIWN